MDFHWKVLAWMLAGVLVGLCLQAFVEASAYGGATFRSAEGGLELVSAEGPAARSGLVRGRVYEALLVDRGDPQERRVRLASPEDYLAVLSSASNGDVLWFLPRAEGAPVREPTPLNLGLEPGSARARMLAPFEFAGSIFLALLKMLIVPLVMSSIITGVAGIGSMKDLRRLGGKTFAYYISTSLLAILVGQVLVNLIQPGRGARLGLAPDAAVGGTEENFIEILRRMVPDNIVAAMGDNGAMLQMIFFALLLGYAITRAAPPHGDRVRELFESFFEVMMKMAQGVLSLLPYGVFALLVQVVGSTGFGVFKPLLLFMLVVTLALLIHAGLSLCLLLRFVGGISPLRWAKAMSPAILTAFSTSSSSMTLPVTLRTVEQRGRVSNKVTSFTLPLGATINMDGTALYECIGVIFLAQYYASLPGGIDLSVTQQAMIVLLALLASVGAAGIPSAGLVMMLTILSALKLPVEGAALLLAVDRPLDMLRTVVNVWSDSCGAAIIARSEGELGPLEAGGEPSLNPAAGP